MNEIKPEGKTPKFLEDFFEMGKNYFSFSSGGRVMTHTRKFKPYIRIRAKEEGILDRAFYHIQSVPYKVSLRWLFYRLFQEGFYRRKKEDYKNCFMKLMSRARCSSFKEWRPNILEDETRKVILKTGGYENIEEAAEGIRDNILNEASIYVDHFYRQKNYIELWFEARAMAGQFEYYTERIDLVPMGGEASIPFKWELAQRLNSKASRYQKPIIILYFGDEDISGHKIKNIIENDIRIWTGTDFEIVWCGLTESQAKKYGVPHNIEGKGYQWEALGDKEAGEIITSSIRKYLDLDIIEEVKAEEEEFEESWRERLEAIFEELKK